MGESKLRPTHLRPIEVGFNQWGAVLPGPQMGAPHISFVLLLIFSPTAAPLPHCDGDSREDGVRTGGCGAAP